ncbi:glycosyltransferase [Thiorhodococcus minor]|uniref:Glycosyltransferase n=1 Tax=Thiorhodococcus minor TaxID=57489 RepID=A0A6M0JYJ1_9GAMM|nr:glycosyltransferase [Thiorhodococcus minor]NEV62566.1 glycosyltransferase [Thiorhodococcus minor]
MSSPGNEHNGSLPSLALESGPVLALAARPGDEVCACGGVLARHAARDHDVFVMVLPELAAEDDAQALAGWAGLARAAGECLGCKEVRLRSRLEQPFGYDEASVRWLIDQLAELAVVRIYAPAFDDPDPARARLGLIAREAVRRSPAGPELATYELSAPMAPTHLADITETVEAKSRAMQCLAELPDAAARMRQASAMSVIRAAGLDEDVTAAEGFRLVGAAEIQDWISGLGRIPSAEGSAAGAESGSLVSVIVRTTARATLDQALDSIAAQTYRRLEVVLVDVAGQGSLGHPSHCGEFPMRTASTGAQLGRGAAANLGLDRALGDYALFLDDDDWLLPEHIASLVSAIAGRGEARAAYAGVACRREEADGEWSTLHVFNEPYDPLRLLIENYLPIHAVLFARDLVGASLRFDETLDVYEDWDFWIQLSALTPLAHVDQVSAVYRIASESGFGLRQQDQAIDPGLARIFGKWRSRWSLEQLLGLVDYAKHRSMYEELREESARKHLAVWEKLNAAKLDLEQWKVRHSLLAAEKRTVEQEVATLHERILAADARQRILESAREADRELLDILGIQSLTDALWCREELARYRSFHGRILSTVAVLTKPLLRPYRQGKSVLLRVKRPLVRLAAHAGHIADTAKAYGVAVVARSLLCRLRRSRACAEPSIRDLWQALELSSIDLKPHPRPLVMILMDPSRVAPDTIRLLKGLAEGQHVPPFELLLHYPEGHPIAGVLEARLPALRRVAVGREVDTRKLLAEALSLGAGEWLLLLSAINIQPNDWLSRMVQCAQDARLSGAPAGAVCVKVMGTDGRLVAAGGVRTPDGLVHMMGAGQDPLAPEFNFFREVDAGSDACLLVSRQALATPDVPQGGEGGLEGLCAALQAAGKAILYQPEVTAVVPMAASGRALNGNEFSRLRRRVLVVDAVMLTPDQDSGSLRMFHLLETFLEQGWHVTFAPSNLEYCEPYGGHLQRRGVEVLHAPQTVSIADFLHRRGAECDLVILSRVMVASALLDDVRLHAPQAWLWFDTVDLHFLREQREADLRADPAACKLAEQRKRQELDLMQRSDLTLVVSHIEREMLAVEAPEVRVEILSNIHDLHPTQTPFEARDAILFIGGFNHDPNVDAVRYYVHEVLPLVWAEIGQVPTYIIGSRPTLDVLALHDPERNLHVTGYVEEVAPYFERARLSIAPLRYGAGVKGKINMSMAYGVPVVATPCAAEGMFLEDGADILIGDDPEAFAKAVVRLYSDQGIWQDLARKGLANIERHFSRRTARETLDRLLCERWA